MTENSHTHTHTRVSTMHLDPCCRYYKLKAREVGSTITYCNCNVIFALKITKISTRHRLRDALMHDRLVIYVEKDIFETTEQ